MTDIKTGIAIESELQRSTNRSGGPMAETVDKMQQSKNCLANCDCINCRDISNGPMAATVDKVEIGKHDYKKLWHMLRRIELGVHESGKIMSSKEMQAGAKIALDNAPQPMEILKGYER